VLHVPVTETALPADAKVTAPAEQTAAISLRFLIGWAIWSFLRGKNLFRLWRFGLKTAEKDFTSYLLDWLLQWETQ
jgi:hypothetical protein